MLTLLFRLIASLAALRFTSPDKLAIVLPLIRRLPVSILSPLTNVVSPPVVNVAPVVRSMFRALATKLTVPSSWLT